MKRSHSNPKKVKTGKKLKVQKKDRGKKKPAVISHLVKYLQRLGEIVLSALLGVIIEKIAEWVSKL